MQMKRDHPSRLGNGLTARALTDLGPSAVAEVFTRAFAGYPVPMSLTASRLDARFRGEGGDPAASYVFSTAEGPAAILLVNRRGWRSRVGAMGVVPTMRGMGVGAEAIRRAVAEARARGDTRLLLEVIESNTPAIRLYLRAGFEVVRPLSGYAVAPVPRDDRTRSSVHEIDPALGAARIGRFGTTDLPWQLQASSLAAMVRPTQCFTNTDASVVAMIDASAPTVRLRALAFDEAITERQAATFSDALRSAFADRPWVAPPIFVELHRARFFAPGGWQPAGVRQLEMGHALAPLEGPEPVDAVAG